MKCSSGDLFEEKEEEEEGGESDVENNQENEVEKTNKSLNKISRFKNLQFFQKHKFDSFLLHCLRSRDYDVSWILFQ